MEKKNSACENLSGWGGGNVCNPYWFDRRLMKKKTQVEPLLKEKTDIRGLFD